jgi:UDP-3-O-[3-hydroxymyristoyl] glucosamine N-acyltransferase
MKKQTAGEIAVAIGARLIGGDGNVQIDGIASIANAGPGDLVFVEEEKYLDSALRSSAAAIVVGDFAQKTQPKKILLITPTPRLAFARAAKLLRDGDTRKPEVHPSAVVHESAKIGEKVSIDARAVIADGVVIGDGTWIGAGCVLNGGVTVGEGCKIHPNVTLYSGTRIGNRVVVHAGCVLGSDGFGYARDAQSGRYEQFPQIGKLEIEDDVEIGANSSIDRGALETTRIGRGTKIDNLVHIGHNCQIGKNVVIAAQAGFAGSVTVEDNVVVGGQVGLADRVHVEEGVLLGAQCGVPSKKIIRGKGVVFWGTPARPIKEYLKGLAALAKLARGE